MARTLTIATRRSALALWQAEHVKRRLESLHPGLTVQLNAMQTRGDRILDVPLAKVGGKGLFVKELETALQNGSADIAVHSMKDVPMTLPEGLILGCILQRETPWDALVSNAFALLEDLPIGARVGTSSLRRQSQLAHLRPDLHIVPLRGNVNTRLDRLDAGEYDAIILAAAGMVRLGLQHRIRTQFDPDTMLPAVGQGVLGIECREGDTAILELLEPLGDTVTRHCVEAERAFSRGLDGGCQVPIAGHASLERGRLTLCGLVGSVDGRRQVRESITGPEQDAAELGAILATRALDHGAAAILGELYEQRD